MQTMRILTGVLAVVVPILISAALLMRLREYRTDLGNAESVFDGSSCVWQFNVMRPSNYSQAGRRLLFWYYAALAVQAAGFAFALWLAYKS